MGRGELMKPGTRNVETFISKLLAHRHTLVSCSFQASEKRVFCLQQPLVNLKHLHLITHHYNWQPGKKKIQQEAHAFEEL